MRHFDNMAKILLLTGTIVGYAYAMEFFIAWYGGESVRVDAFINRIVRTLQLGLLDHDVLQRRLAAVLLVQAGAARTFRVI
jgi:hypothetical protein